MSRSGCGAHTILMRRSHQTTPHGDSLGKPQMELRGKTLDFFFVFFLF